MAWLLRDGEVLASLEVAATRASRFCASASTRSEQTECTA